MQTKAACLYWFSDEPENALASLSFAFGSSFLSITRRFMLHPVRPPLQTKLVAPNKTKNVENSDHVNVLLDPTASLCGVLEINNLVYKSCAGWIGEIHFSDLVGGGSGLTNFQFGSKDPLEPVKKDIFSTRVISSKEAYPRVSRGFDCLRGLPTF
ncbi:hypothetical protein SELMODRAFT_420458 [Selaginella moellendorffii]|uniref:Uncharacterized protein n=1 Tax=Selaginella moellendorffii TaxID=88036 RepID=D8SC20_SELML|nr:hypothetical protein SELMODRAFT_420458 [Selaginella moellendorffii]